MSTAKSCTLLKPLRVCLSAKVEVILLMVDLCASSCTPVTVLC